MPDYQINDDWILNRISSQSRSFGQWLTNILNIVENSLEDAPPEVIEEFKKGKDITSLKKLDDDLALLDKEIGNLGFLGKKTYFTTELKKINLLEEIKFQSDEFDWFMQFKNQQAKDLMNFDFQFFSTEKKKTFGRLRSRDSFPRTKINLQDIKTSKQKRKTKDEILAQEVIII
jgi:hypothetical protein